MNFKNVDDRVYMKSDDIEVNDLFIVVRKNKHQTAYLIIQKERSGSLSLLNTSSGYCINYEAEDIPSLIEDYLSKNNDPDINPIKGYFFAKRFNTTLSINETFGWKVVESPRVKEEDFFNE